MMGIRTHMQKKFLPEQIHLIQTNHQLLARDFLHGIHLRAMHLICLGNNRNGLLTGNPGYANAIQGQALSIDGRR